MLGSRRLTVSINARINSAIMYFAEERPPELNVAGLNEQQVILALHDLGFNFVEYSPHTPPVCLAFPPGVGDTRLMRFKKRRPAT